MFSLPDVVQIPWPWVLACLAVAIVIGMAVATWAIRSYRSWKASRRSVLGNRAEQAAVRLLLRHGYQVIQARPVATAHIIVDGKRAEGVLRGDWLVSRRGFRFVAEVKSTGRAADPTLPETRRQLLEYWLCHPDCGLLLVDTDALTIQEIRFEFRR